MVLAFLTWQCNQIYPLSKASTLLKNLNECTQRKKNQSRHLVHQLRNQLQHPYHNKKKWETHVNAHISVYTVTCLLVFCSKLFPYINRAILLLYELFVLILKGSINSHIFCEILIIVMFLQEHGFCVCWTVDEPVQKVSTTCTKFTFKMKSDAHIFHCQFMKRSV